MQERILVVDDEKEIADLIEVYLKNDGYTVYKFYNGTDALKCAGHSEIEGLSSKVCKFFFTPLSAQDIFGLYFCRRCTLPQMFLTKTFLPVVFADEALS